MMELRKATTTTIPLASHTQMAKSDTKSPQTQLQFSWNAPALPENLSVHYTNPCPIVIEKLKQPAAQQNQGAGDGADLRSSVEFSVVSEEKLNLAVQLARRDVKRKHLQEQVKQHVKMNKCPVGFHWGKESENVSGLRASKSHLKYEHQLSNPPKMERNSTGAKVLLCDPSHVKSEPALSDSPPTRDPGPGPKKEEDKCAIEIRRLQKELQTYIQKIELLATKERSEICLDPEEERRVHIRRQEQAVRSARMLYVLQQQVKQIQEDLEKLSPLKIKHTKKSRAMAKLAAAHRGAIRALQMFVTHFADQSEQQSASAHCKELGNLIRQLSFCSARLEMDSSIPDIIIDLLLQIEDLDSVLSKKESPNKGQEWLSTSQVDAPKSTNRLPKNQKKSCALGRKKSSVARKLLPDEYPESAVPLPHKGISHCSTRAQEDTLPVEQGAVAQCKSEAVRRSGPLKAGSGLELKAGNLKKRGGLFFLKPQGNCRPPKTKTVQPVAKQARFLDPTVAFRLKETKPPIRDNRAPWMPPSVKSPLPSALRHLEKNPENPEPSLEIETKEKEIPEKEVPRDNAASPTEEVEEADPEGLEFLLKKAQELKAAHTVLPLQGNDGTQIRKSENFAFLYEDATSLPGISLEDCHLEPCKKVEHEGLSALSMSDLETMMKRMEEIEHYQETVRRRYNQIAYADVDFWVQESKEEESVVRDQQPAVVHPIQITKLDNHKEPQVAIVLEKPLDASAIDEDLSEPQNGTLQSFTHHIPPQKESGIFLSVPKHVLQNLCDYDARYRQHLKGIFLEEVGQFNPWNIAESLAEELTEEVLTDVAAELHGFCEDYAEAVFTSEFLQVAE
ncbi:protein moonraker [Pseudonaja textilis]|uniref:protein moonraker n=1 Tax=Pseudonaja textilis TaxID=8673 RepID=UPI000EAAA6D2|nr:protein moonraker [Pseudonaja textilis]